MDDPFKLPEQKLGFAGLLYKFTDLVNGQSSDELGSEDLLARQFINYFRHVKFRERLEKIPHLSAAVCLPHVVALLRQLDLHVLHDAVDKESCKNVIYRDCLGGVDTVSMYVEYVAGVASGVKGLLRALFLS